MTDADGSGFSHPLLGLPPPRCCGPGGPRPAPGSDSGAHCGGTRWRNAPTSANAGIASWNPANRYARIANASRRWQRRSAWTTPREATLHLYASRQLPGISPDDGSAETIGTLTTLTSELMPFPAWVSTATGDVVKSNAAANAWFPRMRRPGGNLSRWLLLNPEARDQVVDWPD